MKIAILGYGSQGQSAFEYWSAPENEITICDQDESLQIPPGGISKLGPDYLKDLSGFDLIVRSPSVHPRDIVAANSEAILEKVSSVTNEFLRVCPTKNILGVTGTKGKGTTSTLIAKMLEAAGKTVHLGGNIGTPPLELLKNNIQPEDFVVLELANFQLIDLKYSPHIGVCLMVVPEHLNWHADMEEYVVAKQQLFARQTAGDTAIYYAENDISTRVASAGLGEKIPYFAAPGAEVAEGKIVINGEAVCETSELKLLGQHNWQNACAAVTAVWQITQNTEAIRSVLTTFTGLEHRLEFVREVGGVKYYDDSFGTAPETAIVAIEAFEEPKVVILGGSDKGASFDALAQTVKNSSVRAVVLIGITAPKIRTALEGTGFTSIIDGGENMADIVEAARGVAQPGDIVLLSTGCASFGLFQNYKDRGDKFKQSVQSLA
jgi:UDP-N-acetylmuramoylalanine--D-glutamate ligase